MTVQRCESVGRSISGRLRSTALCGRVRRLLKDRVVEGGPWSVNRDAVCGLGICIQWAMLSEGTGRQRTELGKTQYDYQGLGVRTTASFGGL